MDQHELTSPDLRVRIAADGAELVSVRDTAGAEYLWQAGPVWPRHAPLLFPIVGRLADDTLVHRGQAYRLTQHGFARDRRFEWAERGLATCRLVLRDDAQTRALYPFAFRLDVDYALDALTLRCTMTLHNTGDEDLPASMGAHPAFAWPLRAGVAKEAHTLRFDHPEPAPVRRLESGLMMPGPEASPIVGRDLTPTPNLFATDAVILDRLASHALRYACPGGPSLTISWANCPQLGLWSKPGADFLCIEPWHGYASPAGFRGEFADKPGLLHVAPGGSASIGFSVAVEPSSSHD